MGVITTTLLNGLNSKMSKVLYAVSTGVDSRHLQDVTIHKRLSEAKEAYNKHLTFPMKAKRLERLVFASKWLPATEAKTLCEEIY